MAKVGVCCKGWVPARDAEVVFRDGSGVMGAVRSAFTVTANVRPAFPSWFGLSGRASTRTRAPVQAEVPR